MKIGREEVRARKRDRLLAVVGCLLVVALALEVRGQESDDLDFLLENGNAEAPAAPEDGRGDEKQGEPAEAEAEPVDTEPSGDERPETSVEHAPSGRRVIEEILVTANRRVQNVQDVASGIRVLDGEALEKMGAAGFEDYIFTVPGADLGDSGTEKKVAIRGISNVASTTTAAGGSTSPIGIYLDDVPIQGNGVLPDLALYDLARIEVLKGPQGTLYGEGAMGGAVRMLLNRPDPGAFSVKGETGIGRTSSGGGFDDFQNLAVNVPLIGSWATRLVGSRRADQGFVDFPNRGTRNEDDARNLMGRIHLDGDVWDGFAVSALLFHQRQRLDQFPNVQLEEGELVNRDSETQFADTDFTLAALTIDYDFGFAELTSSSSWFRNDRHVMSRFPFVSQLAKGATGPILGGIPGIGSDLTNAGTNVPLPENEWLETLNDQYSIAQELRLVSRGDGWLEWVGGFFYRTRRNAFDVLIDNDVSDEPPPVGPGLVDSVGDEDFEQLAFFGESTLALPWHFQLGLGLRWFRETAAISGTTVLRGPLFPASVATCGCPDGAISNAHDTATTALTPRFSLTWFADDFRMLYASVAKGTRSGGTNITAITSDIPHPLFDPDSLWAYEIGAKTQWLDGLLTANLIAFYNDWNDLQVLTTETGTTGGVQGELAVILNVARAFSRGIELELVSLPIADGTLGFNLFVGDGEIVEGDEAGQIPDHTPLPQLADLSYAAYADYRASRWPLFGFTPFAHFDTQFVGDRTMGPPNGFDEKLSLDAFQTYNVVAGFSSSVTERWQASLEIHNLTDARPQIGASIIEPSTLTLARPRTWLARVGFRF